MNIIIVMSLHEFLIGKSAAVPSGALYLWKAIIPIRLKEAKNSFNLETKRLT